MVFIVASHLVIMCIWDTIPTVHAPHFFVTTPLSYNSWVEKERIIVGFLFYLFPLKPLMSHKLPNQKQVEKYKRMAEKN